MIDIRKEDIKSLEDLLLNYKRTLSSKSLEKIETQEIIMYAEKAIQNLKEGYKSQFKALNLKPFEKVHTY